METLRDRFWLWAHPAGSHNYLWGIDRPSRMTPAEGAYYLGLKKVFLGCFAGKPQPPWDQDAMALDSMDEVGYTVVGDAGSKIELGTLGYLDEVLRIANKFPNTTGAYFDDFIGFEEREKIFTPEALKHISQRVHAKNLKMWIGIYDRNLTESTAPRLAEFDCVSLWTWRGEDFKQFEENVKKARLLTAGKQLYMGCYLYNYGEKCEFAAHDIAFQLNRYAALIREGVAEGVILLSNVIADLGYEAVEYAKAWMKEHGDEPI